MAKISSAEKLSAPKICVKAEFLSDKIFMYKILSQLLAKLLLIAGPIFVEFFLLVFFTGRIHDAKVFLYLDK